jgi:hypothetical protein
MPKNLLADLFALSQAARAANTLQRSVTKGTHQLLRRHAEGHQRDHGAATPPNELGDSRRYAAALGDVKRIFDEFAANQLGEWRRVRAGAAPTADGFRLHVTFQAKPSFTVQLKPRTMFASMFEGVEASENPRHSYGREKVEYRYLCRFDIVASAACVTVSYRTTEEIDPFGHCRRDLTRSYAAPSMPRGFGTIGERFLGECDASLPRT